MLHLPPTYPLRVPHFPPMGQVLAARPGTVGAQGPREGASHPPGDLPDPGLEPMSPTLQADSLLLSYWGSPIENYRISVAW